MGKSDKSLSERPLPASESKDNDQVIWSLIIATVLIFVTRLAKIPFPKVYTKIRPKQPIEVSAIRDETSRNGRPPLNVLCSIFLQTKLEEAGQNNTGYTIEEMYQLMKKELLEHIGKRAIRATLNGIALGLEKSGSTRVLKAYCVKVGDSATDEFRIVQKM